MKITFDYGKVWQFEELPANSIALDGAVQGPRVEPATRRFSFDHHGGCLRLVTLATCQQVLTALKLGLVVDAETTVFVNDLDADTVVSVWLLKNADVDFDAARLFSMVRCIGETDAHGPIFPPIALHKEITPPWGSKEPQNLALLDRYLSIVDRWIAGAMDAEPYAPPRPARGWALGREGGWVQVDSRDGFADLYAAGFFAAALVSPAADGSSMWTIGKRSDLVPLALGPADLSPARSGDYTDTILGQLAKLEATEHGVASTANWGGGSSIGGSPRLPGGVGSRLVEAQVVEVLQRFKIG
jgi:hypothetical protein